LHDTCAENADDGYRAEEGEEDVSTFGFTMGRGVV